MKPWNFIQVSFSKMCHDLSYKALVTRDTKWNIFPKVKKVIQQPHGRENVTECSFLIEKPYLIYLEGMQLLMPQQILQQRENWGKEIVVCSRSINSHGDTFYGCDQIRGYQACSAGPIISRGQSRPQTGGLTKGFSGQQSSNQQFLPHWEFLKEIFWHSSPSSWFEYENYIFDTLGM